MLAVCTTGPPSPSGHRYLRISNRSSFPRKRESRYPASILDSRWSLPSTRSGAGMTVGCHGAIGRFLQNHWVDELGRYLCPEREGTPFFAAHGGFLILLGTL